MENVRLFANYGIRGHEKQVFWTHEYPHPDAVHCDEAVADIDGVEIWLDQDSYTFCVKFDGQYYSVDEVLRGNDDTAWIIVPSQHTRHKRIYFQNLKFV